MTLNGLTSYQRKILILYALAVPLLLALFPYAVRYNFTKGDIVAAVAIIGAGLMALFVLNAVFRTRRIVWKRVSLSQIAIVCAYSILIAAAEEFIFRGLIQGELLAAIPSLAAVFVSSLVFGIAHLPNDVRGWNIREWNWKFASIAFAAGIPMSLGFAVTESLIVPTMLHALLLAFTLLYTEDERDMEYEVKPDRYQVFLFTSPVGLPLSIASHPWFVVNRKGDLSRWDINRTPKFTEPSWGHLYKDVLPLTQGIWICWWLFPNWYWKGKLRAVIEGGEGSVAQKMADFIVASPETYPYCHRYALGGINSNTYVQWVLNHFPESGIRLPWNAFGKRLANAIR